MPGESQAPSMGEGDRRPIPDPTALTTAALYREIAQLRELMDSRLEGAARIAEERDRRYQERHEAYQAALAAAFEAREKALQEAFDAREKALIAALEAKDKAVEAAFESAEKAITKAEISIEKRADATYVSLADLQRQLSQIMPRQEAENRFTDIAKLVDELKERVGKIESIKVGGKEALSNVQLVLGIIMALIVIGGFVFAARVGG